MYNMQLEAIHRACKKRERLLACALHTDGEISVTPRDDLSRYTRARATTDTSLAYLPPRVALLSARPLRCCSRGSHTAIHYTGM